MFRRLGQAALRTARPRGGHGWPGGSFWSEGTQEGKNGLLFGETHRKVESWELITYSGFGAAFLMTLMVVFGPDRTLQAWAKPVAERELAEEDAAFEKYGSDASYREAMDARLAAHGRHPDRFYDAVMMRREYAVLKAQHAASSGGGK